MTGCASKPGSPVDGEKCLIRKEDIYCAIRSESVNGSAFVLTPLDLQ